MSKQFEKDLCEVLGLDCRKIKELTIRCAAGEIATVHTVELLINPGVSVETISRTFDLVERDPMSGLRLGERIESSDPSLAMYKLERIESIDEVGKSLNPAS